MKRIHVPMYQCDHCGRKIRRRPRMADHERRCFKNPERVPYLGELTMVRSTGYYVTCYSEGNMPPGISWCEWVDNPLPSWWPSELGKYDGCGCLFTPDGWIALEGYRQEYEPPSGFPRNGSAEEVWPDGVQSLKPWARLQWFYQKRTERRITYLDLPRMYELIDAHGTPLSWEQVESCFTYALSQEEVKELKDVF